MALLGWDASNHDWQRGAMDLAQAKAAGIQFATHKLTDGPPKYYKDPYFGQFITRARTAGIPLVGAYHVLWNKDVPGQIAWFLNELDTACPWWRGEPFILQLDCEPFSYNGGAPTLTTIRDAADRLVKATGGTHRPIVYAPQWVYGNGLAGLPYPLWASAYGTNSVSVLGGAYPGDQSSRWAAYSGQTPAILQYGSQVRIGSQPTCDANAYRGTLGQLTSLVHPGGDDMLDDERKALFDIQTRVKWIDGREAAEADGTVDYTDPSGRAHPNQSTRGLAAMHADLKGLGDTVSTLRAEVAAISAAVAKLSQPVVNIDAAALANLPKAPSAAEVVEELAKRIGNG